VLALLGITTVGGFAWYKQDRAGMLSRLCEAGLPNFSRPSIVRADDLGCAILGPKTRVEGVLLSGFEAANFMSKDLGPPPSGGGFTGSTWYTANHSSPRNDQLDRQLERRMPGICVGLATLVVDGWPTVTAGNYGHLGIYSREFYAERVISVKPPPNDMVDRMRSMNAKSGITHCPTGVGTSRG